MGAQHEGGLEVVAVPTERAGVQSGGMGARYLLAPHYALLMNQVLFTTSSEKWVFKCVPQGTIRCIYFSSPFCDG